MFTFMRYMKYCTNTHIQPEDGEQKKWAGLISVGIYKQQRLTSTVSHSHSHTVAYLYFHSSWVFFISLNMCVIPELRNRILFNFHITISFPWFEEFHTMAITIEMQQLSFFFFKVCLPSIEVWRKKWTKKVWATDKIWFPRIKQQGKIYINSNCIKSKEMGKDDWMKKNRSYFLDLCTKFNYSKWNIVSRMDCKHFFSLIISLWLVVKKKTVSISVYSNQHD